ncbi:hypothetical protein JHK87_006671 [Glycine soja]|nr:hypothetical protein JHK87_006671 [Glycine soja]
MTALELPVSDWEDKWIDVYFDISSNLLDIYNLVGSLDLAKVKNSGKGKVLMQAMYGVKVETVFICRVFTVAFSGSSKKLSDLNVADIHSWALHFRRLQNLVNEEIRDGVDTVEIEWLLKTVEELRAGIEKLSQGNDLLAKGVDRFFEAVMTSRDTLLSSVIVPHAVAASSLILHAPAVCHCKKETENSLLYAFTYAIIALGQLVYNCILQNGGPVLNASKFHHCVV